MNSAVDEAIVATAQVPKCLGSCLGSKMVPVPVETVRLFLGCGELVYWDNPRKTVPSIF